MADHRVDCEGLMEEETRMEGQFQIGLKRFIRLVNIGDESVLLPQANSTMRKEVRNFYWRIFPTIDTSFYDKSRVLHINERFPVFSRQARDKVRRTTELINVFYI